MSDMTAGLDDIWEVFRVPPNEGPTFEVGRVLLVGLCFGGLFEFVGAFEVGEARGRFFLVFEELTDGEGVRHDGANFGGQDLSLSVGNGSPVDFVEEGVLFDGIGVFGARAEAFGRVSIEKEED